MTALVNVQGLSRTFPVRGGRLVAVEDASFEIAHGESVALVGESGCGKSTLVRLLTRLLEPTSGRVLFEGHDIGGVPPRLFARSPERARIQKVFQDPGESLNPRFTAFAAIADPLATLGGLKRAALEARVSELADQVALPRELLGRFPHQLSGGQKARVGIARAIALRPALLVLDEPTSALDVSVQAVILRLLDDLRRRLGMSYLFVSHDLSVVRLLCDRVLVMYLGRIVESGPVNRVLTRPAHPYTQALLAAIPAGDPARGRRRLRLNGEPRSPIDPDPNACRFEGRCPIAETRCATQAPEVVALAEGHAAACHFAPESEARLRFQAEARA